MFCLSRSFIYLIYTHSLPSLPAHWFVHVYIRSLAASAPIWQFTDLVPCSAFYDTVSHTWSLASPTCALNLHNLHDDILDMASRSESLSHVFSVHVSQCVTHSLNCTCTTYNLLYDLICFCFFFLISEAAVSLLFPDNI